MVEGQQGLEEYRKDDSHQSLYVGVKRKISLVNVLLTNIIYTLTKKKFQGFENVTQLQCICCC